MRFCPQVSSVGFQTVWSTEGSLLTHPLSAEIPSTGATAGPLRSAHPPCARYKGGFLKKVPAPRTSVMSPTVILEVTSSTLSWDSGTQSSLVLPFLNLGIFDARVHLCKMTASQLSDIGVLQMISKNICTSPSVCSPGFLLIPRTFLFFSFFFCFQSNI